ncbi:MAG: ROK family protein [Acidimicrobiales bacterium]
MTDHDETEQATTAAELAKPEQVLPTGVPPAGEEVAQEETPLAAAPVVSDEKAADTGAMAKDEAAEAPVPAQVPQPVGTKRPAVSSSSKSATTRAATRSTPRKTSSVAAAKKAATVVAPGVVPPLRPTTLAIDIGGTGLKASVLDAVGKLVADRVRVATPYPCPPNVLVEALATLTAPLPSFDRVSAGFPGVVRKGIIVTAPHFVTRNGRPEEPVVAKLLTAWTGFDLGSALEARFGRPVRLANDADLQGLDVVSGSGLEFVVTLGTGVGTALLLDGRLAPHLELAHHPFRKDQTYDEQLGDATLRRIGVKKWRKRFDEAVGNFQSLLNYDHLYIGGGNSRLLVGHVDPSATVVDNLAGILGGIKLWELPEH